TESCEVPIQILGERPDPTADLTLHCTTWPEELDQSVEQTDPRLQGRLFSDMGCPSLFGALKLLCPLQHPFSLVDPLREDCHSAFEITTGWSLHCPKLRLLLYQLCPPGESSAVTFQAGNCRSHLRVFAQLLLRSLNQSLELSNALPQCLHLSLFHLLRDWLSARWALALQFPYGCEGC